MVERVCAPVVSVVCTITKGIGAAGGMAGKVLHWEKRKRKARCAGGEAFMLLIKNGYMIDPKSGREGKLDILTKGDRILRIGKGP